MARAPASKWIALPRRQLAEELDDALLNRRLNDLIEMHLLMRVVDLRRHTQGHSRAAGQIDRISHALLSRAAADEDELVARRSLISGTAEVGPWWTVAIRGYSARSALGYRVSQPRYVGEFCARSSSHVESAMECRHDWRGTVPGERNPWVSTCEWISSNWRCCRPHLGQADVDDRFTSPAQPIATLCRGQDDRNRRRTTIPDS